MRRNESAGNRIISSNQPERRKTNPDYVNIKTPCDEDDNVFYVNVETKKNKTKHAKLKKGAFQFEKYDDSESNNYFELGVGSSDDNSSVRSNGNSSPYMNQGRCSSMNQGRGSYQNVGGVTSSPPGISKSNYIDLNLPKSSLGSPNSRTSSTGSVIHSPISVSPVLQTPSCEYVRIDSNATGAINRSISEHRHKEGKRKNKTLKASR